MDLSKNLWFLLLLLLISFTFTLTSHDYCSNKKAGIQQCRKLLSRKLRYLIYSAIYLFCELVYLITPLLEVCLTWQFDLFNITLKCPPYFEITCWWFVISCWSFIKFLALQKHSDPSINQSWNRQLSSVLINLYSRRKYFQFEKYWLINIAEVSKCFIYFCFSCN